MKPKNDLRARALELRREGASLNEIVAELGIAKSTASIWVRDQLIDRDRERAQEKRARLKLLTEGRWAEHRRTRDADHAAVVDAAAAEVGELTEREIALLGAAIYWCEGAKSKPWRPLSALDFINSDAGLVALFLRFLALVGVSREEIKCRLSIHETADIEAATAWWIDQLGLSDVRLDKPVIKRHKPASARRNNDEDYHGCLIIRVGRRREVYWRIEGLMSGIVAAANRSSPAGKG